MFWSKDIFDSMRDVFQNRGIPEVFAGNLYQNEQRKISQNVIDRIDFFALHFMLTMDSLIIICSFYKFERDYDKMTALFRIKASIL